MEASPLNRQAAAAQARKQALRHQMRAARAALSAEQRVAAAILIDAHLRQLLTALNLAKDDVVAVFLAKGEEVWLDGVIVALIERGQCVVAPVSGRSDEAPFYTLSSVTEGTQIGAWGVREPVQNLCGQAYWPQQIKVALVPGLAFDYQGGRLGYGGGWYDRVLGYVPLSIGVGYDCQLSAQVPCEAHDQRVAFVVTEAQIIRVARLKERR